MPQDLPLMEKYAPPPTKSGGVFHKSENNFPEFLGVKKGLLQREQRVHLHSFIHCTFHTGGLKIPYLPI